MAGIPLVHPTWIIKCLSNRPPRLIPTETLLLPAGSVMSHPFSVFSPRYQEGGIFQHMRILNFASDFWNNILKAAGAILCEPTDSLLSKILYLKDTDKARDGIMILPDIIIVDTLEFSEELLNTKYREVTDYCLQGMSFVNMDMNDNYVPTSPGTTPIIVSTDWVSQCLVMGETLDYKSSVLYTMPKDPVRYPMAYKPAAERYTIGDIVSYYTGGISKNEMNTGGAGSGKKQYSTSSTSVAEIVANTTHKKSIGIGKIIQLSRKNKNSSVQVKISPLLVNQHKELTPAQEDRIISAKQLIGKIIVLSSCSFSYQEYGRDDDTVYCASNEWEENENKMYELYNDVKGRTGNGYDDEASDLRMQKSQDY